MEHHLEEYASLGAKAGRKGRKRKRLLFVKTLCLPQGSSPALGLNSISLQIILVTTCMKQCTFHTL